MPKNTAFAFDLDGVLMKGNAALPHAKTVVNFLKADRTPFIFLTNGGGKTESEKLEDLGLLFDCKFSTQQLVQSHTPFLDLVPEYGSKPVLVIGGSNDSIRELAAKYGFRKVLTSSDIYKKDDTRNPFAQMTAQKHPKYGRLHGSLPHGDFEERCPKMSIVKRERIAAILVWSSPSDWYFDIQVIKDLLLSTEGKIGTRSRKNGDANFENYGYQQDGQPPLFVSNNDFEWPTDKSQQPSAQGSFIAALKSIWAEETKNRAPLEYTCYGKPTQLAYELAERKLVEYNDLVLGKPEDIDTIYMIGDNPDMDMKGTVSFKSPRGLP
ncbi:HAD-superfamily hydrolase [Xylaria sp. CBS 124048]|nr:HAD-superfamily hydrolase [Xylaria sp. CBS 124048]